MVHYGPHQAVSDATPITPLTIPILITANVPCDRRDIVGLRVGLGLGLPKGESPQLRSLALPVAQWHVDIVTARRLGSPLSVVTT
jgi:hypothetical protein